MALSVNTIKEELETVMIDHPEISTVTLDSCLNLNPTTSRFLRHIFQILCTHYKNQNFHPSYREHEGLPESTTHSHRAYYFPPQIQDHIANSDCRTYQYSLEIRGRHVTVDLVFFKDEPVREMEKHSKIIMLIHTWLLIGTHRIPPTCSKTLHIFIYLTDFKKVLPARNEKDINSISVNNVNSAYTSSCDIDTTIVIYRKEEWFKVFIHETFHCLGMDFSHRDFDHSPFIESRFNFQDINYKVFETYCETWARIMNICFSAFATLPKTSRQREHINFLEYCTQFSYYMYYEILFSSRQMHQTLSHHNILYNDILNHHDNNRTCKYQETTSVLSYYIFTGILMNNFQTFIKWCSTNHMKGTNIFQFDDTTSNIKSFCRLISDCSSHKNVSSILSLYHKRKYKPMHNSYMMTYIPGPTDEDMINIIV